MLIFDSPETFYYMGVEKEKRVPDNNGCQSCELRKWSLLDEVDCKELYNLDSNRYELLYKPGEKIYSEGESPSALLCLKRGKVKVQHTGPYGAEQITSLKKPVEFLGLEEVMNDHSYSSDAYALEDSVVCFIPKENFLKVIRKDQVLAMKVIQHLAGRIEETESRMVGISQKHMRARMADTLLRLIEVYGFENASQSIDARLKRSELAALSNMTTANAIRVLSAFTDEGVIKTDGRKITILDQNKLQDLSI